MYWIWLYSQGLYSSGFNLAVKPAQHFHITNTLIRNHDKKRKVVYKLHNYSAWYFIYQSHFLFSIFKIYKKYFSRNKPTIQMLKAESFPNVGSFNFFLCLLLYILKKKTFALIDITDYFWTLYSLRHWCIRNNLLKFKLQSIFLFTINRTPKYNWVKKT